MRRRGYFATLSGGRAQVAAAVLTPPARLFAHERVPAEALAPAVDGFTAAASRAVASPPRDTPVGPPARTPIEARDGPRVRTRAPVAREVRPAPTRPPARAQEPVAPHPAPQVGAERTSQHAAARPPQVALSPPSSPHRAAAPEAGPRPARTQRAARAGERSAPQVRIGAIEVTVVPPPPPPLQAARTAAPRPRRSPVRGPERPAPWFGLAQR